MYLDVMEIASIKEREGKFKAKMNLTYSWFDGRLKWRDLQDKTDINILSKEEANRVWLPKIIFSNSDNSLENMSTGAVVIKKNSNYSRSFLVP